MDVDDLSPQYQQAYLYAWGRNKDGELSIGQQKKSNVPKAVQGVKNLLVKQVSSSNEHSALVTEDGLLFICGSALHGKLGFEDANQTIYPKFIQVQALTGFVVQQVATGDYHTLCLLDNGDVYAWGGTLHKKLGSNAKKPARVQTLTKRIVQIGCGDFHSAALSQDGELYTWGGGGKDYNRGQLGLGNLNDQEIPTKVLENIVKFSCGGYHMMALDQNGDLYSWGSGSFGETGLGDFSDYSLPKKVKVNFNQKQIIVDDLYIKDKQQTQILDIKLGGHHSLLLNNKGFVYSCGSAQNGQLGMKVNENQNKFQLVVGLAGKTIIQIAAGWNHSLALTSNSDVYICGHNQVGQLGIGDEESQKTFVRITQLQQKRIKSIFAGGNHTWALIDYNQPRLESYSPPSPLTEEIKIDAQNQQTVEQLQDLEVLISEVMMTHRFIKIQVPQLWNLQMKMKINEYMNTMQRDPDIKLIKYQDDIEAQQQQQFISQQYSYTVMIVVDLSRFHMSITDDLEDGKIIQSGKQYLVKRNNIKKNPLYDWIIQAEKIMTIPGIVLKYLEIRPQQS